MSKGVWPGIVAVTLGVLAWAITLAPADLSGVRPYVPWLFGLPGLALAIVALTGGYRGKAWAIAGAALSGLALLAAAVSVMLA